MPSMCQNHIAQPTRCKQENIEKWLQNQQNISDFIWIVADFFYMF